MEYDEFIGESQSHKLTMRVSDEKRGRKDGSALGFKTTGTARL
jgi:hypothetical protein